MFSNIYKKIVIDFSKFTLFLLLICITFAIYQSKNFNLDASSDALLLEGDPDLSEHANLLFGGKKLTKEQLEKIKKDFGVVEKKVINDDTTKAKKPKVKTTITTTSTKK